MADAAQMVSGSIGQTMGLLGGRWRVLGVDFLKVLILTALISIATQLLSQAAVGLPLQGAAMLVIMVVMILILLIGQFLESAISSVLYNVVEQATLGKRIALLSQAKLNFIPVARGTIAVFAAYVVLALPLLLGVIAGDTTIFCALGAVSLALMVVFSFFTQFLVPELVILRRDWKEGLRGSFEKVRSNLVPTILFDVVVILVSAVMAALLLVLLLVVSPVVSAGGLAGMVIGLAIMLVLVAVLGLLIGLFSTTFTYFFWSSIGGKGPSSPGV